MKLRITSRPLSLFALGALPLIAGAGGLRSAYQPRRDGNRRRLRVRQGPDAGVSTTW